MQYYISSASLKSMVRFNKSGDVKRNLRSQVLSQFNSNVTADSILPKWHFLYCNFLKTNTDEFFPPKHIFHNLKVTKTEARKWIYYVFGGKPTQLQRKPRNRDKEVKKYHSHDVGDCNLSTLNRKRKLDLSEAHGHEFKRRCITPSIFIKTFGFLQDETNNPAVNKNGIKSGKVHISRTLRKAIPIGYNILKHICNKSLYLIDVHCPLMEFNTLMEQHNLKQNNILTTDLWKRLLSFHCSQHQVFLYLRSVLIKILPRQLVWGSSQNEQVFYKKVKYLISLRRYDKVCAGHLSKGLSIMEIPWLSNSNDSKHLLCKFVTWVFMDLIFVILKKFFYITDHADYKNRLLYYRKEVWFAVTNFGIASLIDKKIWCCASETGNVNQEMVFTVRFLPKESGLRPIMKRMIKKTSLHASSLHYLKVFQIIKERQSHLLGCATNGINGIHKKWTYFWKRCQKIARKNKGNCNLYFVKVDIKQCFDRIPTEKLLQIVEHVLKRTENLKLNGFRKKFLGCFTPGESVKDYSSIIYDHIKNFLATISIMVQNKRFVRLCGIPQGWELSSILCDFFYGSLENNNLLHFARNVKAENPTSSRLLMRYVDDFLFVSTSQAEAEEFVRVMHTGFPDYGCSVNTKKSLINFQYSDSLKENVGCVKILKNVETFPWYSLLFPQVVYYTSDEDPKYERKKLYPGGVSINFDKYFSIGNIRDFTSVFASNEKCYTPYTMFSSINLRIIPLCFDRKINSTLSILKNIHDLACITTLLWLAHDHNKMYSDRTCLFPSKAVQCIQRIATCKVLSVIRKNFPNQKFPNRTMVLWIFYRTFLKQFRLHYGDYKEVCLLLQKSIHTLNKKMKEHRNWKKAKLLLHSSVSTFPVELKSIKYK